MRFSVLGFIELYKNIILSLSDISTFKLVFVADQAGLNLTLSDRFSRVAAHVFDFVLCSYAALSWCYGLVCDLCHFEPLLSCLFICQICLWLLLLQVHIALHYISHYNWYGNGFVLQ